MKTTTFTCLALLILTLPAARGEPFRTDINPALLYYQAFLMAPEPMSDTDGAYLYSKAGLGQNLPERFGKIAAGYDNEFKLVREAAQQKVPCDWGIDMSPGPATLLPHLALSKAVSIATRFRVMWDLQHGRQADACEDWLAALTLGRNVSCDGTLIGALVQNANEAIECATVAGNFGQFSPESLQQLAKGIEAAPARRTVAACIPTEKAFFEDWLVHKIVELQKANPGDDTKVMTGIHEVLTGMLDPQQDLPRMALHRDSDATNWWAQLTQAAGGTSKGIVKLVRDLEPLYQKLALILALPPGEYDTQMEKFKTEVQQSPNPLALLIFPTWQWAQPREFKIQAWLAMVRAAVEYKLHGEPGLQSVMDPLGNGPFAFQRFVFDGVDRGFELKSTHSALIHTALIFVEKQGPPFRVDGPHIGEAVQP